jgi:hypothetical protein
MLHYTRLERLASDKYSSLLGPFVRYEENKVLRLWPLNSKFYNQWGYFTTLFFI